jgi:hypothetical protein
VKADGTKSNLLAEFSDYEYIENRREMEGSKSVLFGSPNGIHAQPSEPVPEKDSITSMAHKRADYGRVGNDRGAAMVQWAGN